MVLAQKQTQRETEQDKESRNEPMILWPINLQQRRQEYTIGKRQSFQQMVLGKQDRNMQKNETGPLSYIIHKGKLKMSERPKCETGNHQNPRAGNRQQHL